NGIIHFTVRGAPEIPGVDEKAIPLAREELKSAGLRLIEDGIENLQSCFGNYCLEGLADPQNLLRRIEGLLLESDHKNLKITISASGCPNSCGIAHLSDIGFHGVCDPVVDTGKCTGCGLCTTVCKRTAIQLKGNRAFIDYDKCGYCGQCAAVCPLDAIREERRGFAVLLGGRGGRTTRLGTKIASFVSEDEALAITQNLIDLAIAKGRNTGEIIDEYGIEQIRELIIPEKLKNKGGHYEP
ncbi:MAG: 4Fe-4S binding protein, partial [Dehalococcoidales bacterium]|nr:4Fe-4S binding protein [Dehalococcoidales bacterium]